MPLPSKNETESAFVQRCIPLVLKDETASDGKQAAAIAHAIFARANKMPLTSAVLRSTAVLRGGMGPVTRSDKTVTVDKDKGIIHNVSLMTIGPAEGWPFDIDGTTLDQLVAFANEDPNGIKIRFGHPEVNREMGPDGDIEESIQDDIGKVVGRVKNARRDGDCARGDVEIGPYAQHMPSLGDVRTWLLSIAEHDPEALGMSAMFPFSTDPQLDDTGKLIGNPARLHGLEGIDIVGRPAANPAGLLSAKTVRTIEMPEVIVAAPADQYLADMVESGQLRVSDVMARCSEDVKVIRDRLLRLCAARLAKCTDGAFIPTKSGRMKYRAAKLWLRK